MKEQEGNSAVFVLFFMIIGMMLFYFGFYLLGINVLPHIIKAFKSKETYGGMLLFIGTLSFLLAWIASGWWER